MLPDLVGISVQQGLLYSPVAIGVALTFRFQRFPDLTVDGSFALGGAIAAVGILSGMHPAAATVLAVAGGAAAGTLTGLTATVLRVNRLLAGILVMTVLYSLNLRVAGGANLSLLRTRSIIDPLLRILPSSLSASTVAFGIMAAVLLVALSLLLWTNFGVRFRASGTSPKMAVAVGVDPSRMTVIATALSNAIVALGGSAAAQHQGFFDISMGVGMIIVGLASILIGEGLMKAPRSHWILVAAVVGAVVYQLIINAALRLGLAPTDLKMATGVLVVVALAVRQRLRQEVVVAAD